MNNKNKGFASMSSEARKDIARRGGKTHSKKHMSEIGRKGGLASGEVRKKKDKPEDEVLPGS